MYVRLRGSINIVHEVAVACNGIKCDNTKCAALRSRAVTITLHASGCGHVFAKITFNNGFKLDYIAS